MADLKMNIYAEDDHSVVEKTYEADTFDLMFGTLEDFMDVINIEEIKSRQQIAANVMKGFRSLRPLLKDVFPGVTDDELRRTKVPELMPLFVEIFDVAVEQLGELGEKNGRRA